MERNIKVGDRFRRTNFLQENSIWESIRDMEAVCIKSTNPSFPEGMIRCWNFYYTEDWEFIGNFSKSNNFTELYDLLNEDENR